MNFYYKPDLSHYLCNYFTQCVFSTIPNLSFKLRYKWYNPNKAKYYELLIIR